MNTAFENIDELLGKYLAGEATQTELVLVEAWLSASEENRHYFEQLKLIFNKAAAVKDWQAFDTDTAWNKVRTNLQRKKDPVIPIQKERKISPSWWQLAAGLLILLGVTFYFYKRAGVEPQILQVVAENTAVNDTLPDGTNVFLNKETKLIYAFDRKTNTHEIKLDGEAYFNVKHSKREEFIIDAGGVYIRDIGTSFNVKAYPGTDEVEVLVEEGEIVFFTKENPGIHLKESGKAVYNKSTKSFSIEQPDPNITAYKTKFFVFSATTLESIAEALNHVYDTTLIVPDHLKTCPMTVSFRDESIGEIVAVITETLGISASSRGNSIVLEGKGCE